MITPCSGHIIRNNSEVSQKIFYQVTLTDLNDKNKIIDNQLQLGHVITLVLHRQLINLYVIGFSWTVSGQSCVSLLMILFMVH